jgi:uncharacterized protein involved in exopolysaccharide biosynthesis
MQEKEISIDWSLVLVLVRSRRKQLATAGAAIWAGILIACLFLMPRTYTATASIALQQTASAEGALASLAALGGGESKNYQGVIYSRAFATYAARKENIQTIYGLQKEKDAIDLVQRSIKLEDKMDGLLYVNINLPAPPRLAFWRSRQSELIRRASAWVAYDYVRSLKGYLASSNSNRDAALVREAQKQLVTARRNYDSSVGKLGAMLQAAPVTSLAAAAGPPEGADTSSVVASKPDAVSAQLQALFIDQSQLDSEIQAMRAAQSATVKIVDSPAQAVASLPGEDPLLMQARAEVRADQTNLQNLRVTLSDDNPDVVAAKERLQIAQDKLAAQGRSIAQGKTTQSIQLDALQAKYADVQNQITALESQIKTHSAGEIALANQRNEVLLSLEVLKATATEYATLSVTKMAGNNLMDVVDAPQAPDFAQPGIALFAAMSFFLTLFALQAWIAFEYVSNVLRQRSEAEPVKISKKERKAA